jgi:3-oxoacyl-[acyl-carrier-protein] synthase II
MSDAVAVTGMGAVTGLGHSLEETWGALLAGKQAIRRIQRFAPSGFPTQRAAELGTLSQDSIDSADRQSRIATLQASILSIASHAAWRSAHLDEIPVAPDEIGFFAGLGAADYNIEELLPAVNEVRRSDGTIDYRSFFLEHYRKIHPLWLLTQLNNIALCQAAISLNIRGENAALSQYADAGAHAIGDGFYAVQDGRVRLALVGGVSEAITPVSLARSLLLNMLSTTSDGVCRPFAHDRSGTLLGEGGAVLVLERLSSATERNAPCLALLKGIGSTCELDGQGPSPTPVAIRKAMEHALSSAGIGPEAIDLIIANGDGSIDGDRNEMAAIDTLFGGALDSVRVLSVKGAVGHLLAGAPALDVALGVQMLQRRAIPGMAPDIVPDPVSRLRFVIGQPLQKPLRHILVNAQGFAGQCVSIILSGPAKAA